DEVLFHQVCSSVGSPAGAPRAPGPKLRQGTARLKPVLRYRYPTTLVPGKTPGLVHYVTKLKRVPPADPPSAAPGTHSVRDRETQTQSAGRPGSPLLRLGRSSPRQASVLSI